MKFARIFLKLSLGNHSKTFFITVLFATIYTIISQRHITSIYFIIILPIFFFQFFFYINLKLLLKTKKKKIFLE